MPTEGTYLDDAINGMPVRRLLLRVPVLCALLMGGTIALGAVALMAILWQVPGARSASAAPQPSAARN